MKDDRVYLNHIGECLDWIATFTALGREAFLNDRKTQSAVLREIQTMTESLGNLSETVKATHPEISWRSITGFRNILVHDYLGIKLERVWEVIERDLPALRVVIASLQQKYHSPDSVDPG